MPASGINNRSEQVGPILSFHHPSGEAVTWGEFDPAFLKINKIGPSSWDQPVRVQLVAQQSKRGNTYFCYEQGELPLPDGLETELHLDATPLEANQVGQSKRGNATRRYSGTFLIGGIPYEVVGYVTESRSPYWVKVHVQKLAKGWGSAGQPHGGRFV